VVYSDVVEADEKVGALALLADLAREYAAEKHRIGVLDFSDQVAGALEVVRTHPVVADEVRDRFRVVLLDEYQDTSVVQTDLLAALFAGTGRDGRGRPPSGDLRLARRQRRQPRRVRGKPSHPGAPCAEFSLATSWRNSARVLAAANAVLAPLAASASVAVHELRARRERPTGEVELAFDADLDAEADRVAEWFAGVRGETRLPRTPDDRRDPVPQQEAHGALRRRTGPARHPAPHPGPGRAAVHPRGGRRRLRAAGAQRPERRGRR
jgi:DNA helicase-2/ATP-dependent DNA helicase PcrA